VLRAPPWGPGQSPVRKRISEHFSTQKTTSGDIKFHVFAMQKNKHNIFGPPRPAAPTLQGLWGQ